MSLVIRDGAALNRAVSKFSRRHAAFVGASEGLAWEILAHTAKHGEASLLNKFLSCLDGSWATALGVWVGKVMVDPKYANINSDTNKAVRWMSFKDGMFTVKPGVEKDRHDWLDRVVEDDDRVGFLHVKRDDNKISSAFDDAKVVEMLKALAKKASKDASEVSTSIVQLLDEAVAKVERVARPRVSADTE
jgi:hypothetical protein